MILYRGPFLALVLALGILAFTMSYLPGARGLGEESLFVAALLTLVLAAAVGPCTFDAEEGASRWMPAAGAAWYCTWIGAVMVLAAAMRWSGPWTAVLGVGLFAGLFAFACGAVAHALGGGVMRVFVAGAACLLLTTFFYWDEAFLFDAANRKQSAAMAFDLNPAAAASVTLGFDWIHAKGLYSDNQTAESLAGIELRGVGPYSLKLAIVAALATLVGLWRKP